MSALALICQALVIAVIVGLIVHDLRQSRPTAPVAGRMDDPDWLTLHQLAQDEEKPAARVNETAGR